MTNLDTASEAAYFASIWGLSNPRMKALEEAFRKFLAAGTAEPRSAYEAVRALIKPDSILNVSEIHLDRYPRKAVFNALTHLARTGYLVRIGYGRYQSPPASTRHPSIEGNNEIQSALMADKLAGLRMPHDPV